MSANILRQNAIMGRDVTVLSAQNVNAASGASVGSPVNFVACFDTCTIKHNRTMTDVTAANDQAEWERPSRFGKGEMTLSNFIYGTSNALAAFVAGAWFQISYAEGANGDLMQVLGCVTSYEKSVSKDPAKDTITLSTYGIPSAASGNGTSATGLPAGIPLT